MAISRKTNTEEVTNKLYDTNEKRLKTLRKTGNIITFKVPYRWKGVSYHQIDVVKFKVEKNGACKIIGFTRDTPLFDTINQIIDAVDWDIMERWHGSDRNFRNKLP